MDDENHSAKDRHRARMLWVAGLCLMGAMMILFGALPGAITGFLCFAAAGYLLLRGMRDHER